MSAKIIDKPKRSLKLTEKQLQFLNNRIEGSESLTAAAISLGISKDVLSRTLAYGSCSEKTYNTLFGSSTTRKAA